MERCSLNSSTHLRSQGVRSPLAKHRRLRLRGLGLSAKVSGVCEMLAEFGIVTSIVPEAANTLKPVSQGDRRMAGRGASGCEQVEP